MINQIHLISFSLAILPWFFPLPGQEDFMLIQLEELGGRLVPKALGNHITIETDEITFKEALLLIAIKGNLRLSYNCSRLPMNQRISLHLHNIPVLDVLLSILNQTNTELVITQNGQLVVVARKQQESQ